MRLAIDGQKKTSPVEHFDAKSSVTLAWIMHEAISSSMEVEEMVSERQN